MTPRPTSRKSRFTVQDFPILTQRSKYGVNNSAAGKAARTYGGRVFSSIAEMKFAQELDIRKLAGDIQDWWPQIVIPLMVNGIKVAKVVCDFKILNNDNTVTYCEIKGVQTETFRLKLKLLKAVEPTIDYRVIKA